MTEVLLPLYYRDEDDYVNRSPIWKNYCDDFKNRCEKLNLTFGEGHWYEFRRRELRVVYNAVIKTVLDNKKRDTRVLMFDAEKHKTFFILRWS